MAILLIAFILTMGLMINRYVVDYVGRIGRLKGFGHYRVAIVTKTMRAMVIGITTFLALFIAGVDYSQISVLMSSVFAVIGVCLFAQWSILSNLTAGWIIFFHFPYRIGDVIRIADKDDDLSGTIMEITAFHVVIEHGDNVITYPNSVILQKAVIKLRAGTAPSLTHEGKNDIESQPAESPSNP